MVHRLDQSTSAIPRGGYRARFSPSGFFISSYILSRRKRSCYLGNGRERQEIPRNLRNLKVHHRLHPNPLLAGSWARSVLSTTSKLISWKYVVYSNSILPITKCLLSLKFSHQSPIHTFSLHRAWHISRPSRSSWFNRPDNIWRGSQIMNLPIVQFRFPVTSSLFGANVFFSIILSKTLSLYSCLSVRDQVWHLYTTAEKQIWF